MMADENPQNSPVGTQQPADIPQNQGTGQVTADDVKGKTPDEIVKIAEELGGLKKTAQELEEYRKITQPFIETIVSDPDLMKSLEEKHTKRLGIQSQNPQEPPKPEETPQQTLADDTRKGLTNQIIGLFERERGLDRLEGDPKKEIQVKIGQELMEMLDPGGTKTYAQVLAGISLEKLPRILEKAYNLATMEEKIQKVAEEAKNQVQIGATGQISSIPSTSAEVETVTLTPKERDIAKKLGITEEKYLERKKQIIASYTA